ncbi:MAG: type II secretion system protein [Limisphaerales bacterium]|jgi:prepilin-type N-terminal cleavage/methylation domain-containing protein
MRLFKDIREGERFTAERQRAKCGGFTMIEIAIALAVIGIALVAIIGVLPSGFNIRRDNRTDTLIYNDARFFMEAIKSGARGVANLEQYVDSVNGVPAAGLTSRDIIGMLSEPDRQNVAIVRSLAGTPSEMAQETKDLAFRYQLTCELIGFPNGTDYASSLKTNLYELKLTFNYPVRGDGSVVDRPSNRRTFRTMISGNLTVETNTSGKTLYFFKR